MHLEQPAGAFRRRIILNAGADWCAAAIEDDFHRFAVRLAHDRHKVTSVVSRAFRAPWSLCPEAGARLQDLVDCPLTLRPWQDLSHIDAKTHCTHQYDLALLAVAQAMRGGRRQYDVTVPDTIDARRMARIERNSTVILELALNGTRVQAPEPFIGQDLRSIREWAFATLDDDFLEAIVILRRVVLVSHGRGVDLDKLDSAAGPMSRMAGACYVYQPENAARGLRVKGNVKDFSNNAEDLLRNLDPQLGPYQ